LSPADLIAETLIADPENAPRLSGGFFLWHVSVSEARRKRDLLKNFIATFYEVSLPLGFASKPHEIFSISGSIGNAFKPQKNSNFRQFWDDNAILLYFWFNPDTEI